LTLGRHAEIQADRLGVPDVEIAVRFGRESGRHTAVMLSGGEVLVDDAADEVHRRRCRRGRLFGV
jgi:hypothetical protein